MMELPRLFTNERRLDLRADLQQWFVSDLGAHLLQTEEQLLSRILPDLFGYHALQVGHVVDANLLAGSRIRHRCVADVEPVTIKGLSPLRAAPEQLPFASASLDLVFLHHGLDASPHPQALLREASRVLIPEGHLLILGFNPWSLWGLWRLFRWQTTVPWLRRPLSPQRLADWLPLLELEVVGVESACFVPPLTHATIRRRFAWLEKLGRRYWSQGGAAYVLLARKRVSCVTPIEPRRRNVYPAAAPAFVTEARLRSWMNRVDE